MICEHNRQECSCDETPTYFPPTKSEKLIVLFEQLEPRRKSSLEGAVQKAYNVILNDINSLPEDDNWSSTFCLHDILNAIKIKEKTGIKPAKQVIERGYEIIFRNGFFISYLGGQLVKVAETFENFTETPPDEQIVQNEYGRLLNGSVPKQYLCTYLDEMYDLTGIEPSEKILDEAFRKLVGKYKSRHNDTPLDFKYLIINTNFIPSEKIIQDMYRLLLEKRELEYIEEIMKLTKIEPKLSKQLIQQAYLKGVIEDNWGAYCLIDNAKLLKKATKISIYPKTINKIYKHYISKGDLISLNILKEWSKFPVPDKLVKQDFVNYLNKKL